MKNVVSLTRRLVRMHMAFRPVALHISLGCRINLDGLLVIPLVIPEEVSGSSYPVPVITSPMCPCLHLRAKQQVLIWTNLSLIAEIMNWGVFLQENPVRAVKTTMWWTSQWIESGQCAMPRLDVHLTLGVFTSEWKWNCLSLFSFSCYLAILCNSKEYVMDSECISYWDHNEHSPYRSAKKFLSSST